MTRPAHRKSDNIELSFRNFLKDNFATPNSITINYGDKEFDASSYDLWVDFSVLTQEAGRKGVTMFQLDIYSRIRGNMPDGDRLQTNLRTAAVKLVDALHVDSIDVYDYAVPASPVLTAGRLMIQNSNGTFREPNSDRMMGIEDDVARRSLTYRTRLLEDASVAPSYYD